jgi:putative spermidine/putrescine transport system substrate-binding protein
VPTDNNVAYASAHPDADAKKVKDLGEHEGKFAGKAHWQNTRPENL